MIKNHIFQKVSLFAISAGLLLTSCSKDNKELDEVANKQEVVAVKDLNGLDKGGVYFSLEKNRETEENSTDWDIKITGTTIGFGNGAVGQLVEGVLDSYHTAPTEGYSNSGITGNNTYYVNTLYNAPQHAILMKPGVLILVKTSKGNYVKLEMLSYYKGSPNVKTPDFADIPTRGEKWPKQHYTFNYVLQSNGTNKF
ncbi:HmuY family protein [Sphingobacterium tabacisoli]|uniref:HmuY family protein n=1 Tax=Sphingobacterium tabacisoli TaxID=2044855 RepID=A0ABW5KXF7_9SPHI|nr:HmuY family protein [Sphingobacterium tabacisoli]